MARRTVSTTPHSELRKVTAGMVAEAVKALRKNAPHNFGRSLYYDLIDEDGTRLPPKAVFGLALAGVIGRAAKPEDFSAGDRSVCFDVLRAAGYEVAPKADSEASLPVGAGVVGVRIFDNRDGAGDEAYIRWTTNNPSGFILQTSRRYAQHYIVLHRASCGRMTRRNSNHRDDAFTGKVYIKICSKSRGDLFFYCEDEGYDYPRFCKICRPNESRETDDVDSLLKRARKEGRKHPLAVVGETTKFLRSAAVVELAKKLAAGSCGLCEKDAPFDTELGPFLEVHHIDHLSDGGADTIENAIALCPNCHRRIHYATRDADVRKLKRTAKSRLLSLG